MEHTTFIETNSHRAHQQFLNTNVPFDRHTDIKTKHPKNKNWFICTRVIYEIPREALYRVKPIKGITIFKNNPIKEHNRP